jgi:DNA-binding LacI/PurR family transcriptional regulator
MRLEDVAKRANVSISTVSRVVNETNTVSGATRKRVLAALEELNYTPNLQARLLVSGTSKTLGIVVSNLENPFFVDLFHRLEAHATREGYELIVANTNYEPERLAQTLRNMRGRCVAGIAIAASETLPREVSELITANIPIVCINTNEALPGLSHIRVDARSGMRKLVDHLASLGHRRIAYLCHDRNYTSDSDERHSTFVETCTTHGVEHVHIHMPARESWEDGRNAVRQLISRGFDASAIVCVNDMTALSVLRALRDRDINCPGHVSVTGFDNIPIAHLACPSLTTADIPRDTIAAQLFKSLTAKPGTPATDTSVDPELIVRESTGPFRGYGLLSSKQDTPRTIN